MAPPPPSSSKDNMHAASTAALLLLLSVASPFAAAIGVNYGTKGDNLPPPATVASFLANRTRINRVKLFDTNPDIVRAFAGTGISLVVTAGNGDIPALATKDGAAAWVAANVAPHYPATDISLVAVGNEIMDTGDPSLIGNLVPAMRSLKAALVAAGYRRIRVSTPHSLGVLAAPPPAPSASRFRPVDDLAVIKPMLEFHRATRSPFMVNAYPYFGYNGDTVGYALARPQGPGNPGVLDPGSGITYTSMFQAQLDSVFSAMKALGFEDVEIAVGETGWPTKAMDGQAGVGPDEAAEYNRYLIREASGGSGTPLMPKRTFETYIFALFNEDLKPGPVAERNFGMFQPDLTPVYDVGLMKDAVKTAAAPAPAAIVASTSNATTKLNSEDAAPPTAETKPANSSSKAAASAPAPSSGDEAAGPTPSKGGSTDDEKTPEDGSEGDAPAGAASDPAGGESSEAESEDDDAEGSPEKPAGTTPAPGGASSEATSLVAPISTMLTLALSLAIHI
ncbi:hypothetical protein EJB05_13341, partial [Eragrostis curvula]